MICEMGYEIVQTHPAVKTHHILLPPTCRLCPSPFFNPAGWGQPHSPAHVMLPQLHFCLCCTHTSPALQNHYLAPYFSPSHKLYSSFFPAQAFFQKPSHGNGSYPSSDNLFQISLLHNRPRFKGRKAG